MKVKDLQEKLSKFDPELDVLCYSEDEALLLDGHNFRIIEIESIDSVDSEKCSTDDGVKTLKLGKSDHSQEHVTLNVTTLF